MTAIVEWTTKHRWMVERASVFGLAVLLLAIAGVTGCSRDSAPKPQATHTMIGPGGEELAVPDPIRGLIPANGAVVDLIVELVETETVAGLPADSLKFSNLGEKQHAIWSQLPTVADLHLEELLSAGVDFVIAHDWQRPKLDEVLGRTSISALYLPTAQSFEDLIAAVRWTGEALQAPSRAEVLIERLETLRQELEAHAPSLEGQSAMVYSNYGAGGGTSGSGTSYDVMIRLAGLLNAATEAGIEGHQDLSIEGLLAIQPDFLVMSGTSMEDSTSLDSLRAALQGAPLAAVDQGRVLFLDSNQLTTTSHHIVFAAKSLQEQALAAQE